MFMFYAFVFLFRLLPCLDEFPPLPLPAIFFFKTQPIFPLSKPQNILPRSVSPSRL